MTIQIVLYLICQRYKFESESQPLQALQHDFNFDFKWDKELNTIQITSKHK